jgi:hypothetical protein
MDYEELEVEELPGEVHGVYRGEKFVTVMGPHGVEGREGQIFVESVNGPHAYRGNDLLEQQARSLDLKDGAAIAIYHPMPENTVRIVRDDVEEQD